MGTEVEDTFCDRFCTSSLSSKRTHARTTGRHRRPGNHEMQPEQLRHTWRTLCNIWLISEAVSMRRGHKEITFVIQVPLACTAPLVAFEDEKMSSAVVGPSWCTLLLPKNVFYIICTVACPATGNHIISQHSMIILTVYKSVFEHLGDEQANWEQWWDEIGLQFNNLTGPLAPHSCPGISVVHAVFLICF